MLTAKRPHRDPIALTKSLLIAVRKLFYTGLALSVTFGDTSSRGGGLDTSKIHYSYRGKALVRASTRAEMSSFFSS